MNDNASHVTARTKNPSTLFRILAPSVIFIITAVVAVIMILTRPKPTPRTVSERAALVNTIALQSSTEKVTIHTTGTVKPALEVTLLSRTAGEVIWTDPRFIPGGRFEKDEVILALDPADYEIALTNAAAGLTRAEFELKTEMGLQDIARHEWSALQNMNLEKAFTPLEEQLATRRPHLKLVESNLSAAGAVLRQAELNLQRTRIKAPFNCVIRSRNVNQGSVVSPQTPLADISGTDSLWVMATLPVSHTKWILSAHETGGRGSSVTVSSVPGIDLNAAWEGHVLRKLVDIEKSGMQAQIIIEIPSPQEPVQGKGSLILGSYVRLAIAGIEVENVFKIPASSLHNGNELWIKSKENRLDVRTVETVWKDSGDVLVSSGIENGESIIISDLGTPVHGMLLQDTKDKPEGSGKKEKQ